MSEAALTLSDMSSGYKDSIVVRNVSLSVHPGEIVALVGKNGMGKTTLLKSIMGYLPKQNGSVRLFGKDVTRQPAHRVARSNIAYAPQSRSLFHDLNIRDNLRLGLSKDKLFDERFAEVEDLFPFLKGRMAQRAGTLSGGEQKMLLIARALMVRPALILIDEVTEGMQPSVIDRVATALLHQRKTHGTSILFVEQNVPFAVAVADRYTVLKLGEIVETGDTAGADCQRDIMRHLSV
ncbi:ABC transporter ATP-binding protein [Herbaspirillum lusitanum]|jgi:branched-chain amino acid transport system ATP-binding protein|uniref:ABC transporter ATP-binding protein n=1 Tax=Herbaspirillum rhizosphaerae TaxID=346179 RepID=A0ABW8Z5U2_9BURK|nr:ABC transporter ATP-binding protein [Herbaspirillum lusitanum]MCW5300372.1 ABC transporter ATP-binding protein [Herbaspirillum lusitanum]